METTLTIKGTPSELAAILATLGGTVAAGAIIAATGVTADDDESGDTAVQPGTVDKNGIPWDDRIHSTPAKLTNKNVWRAKRGVNDALVAQVEAELRARGVPAQTQPVQQMQQPIQQPAPQFTPQQQPMQMQQPAPQFTPVMQQPVVQQPAPQFTPQQPMQTQPVQQMQQPAPVVLPQPGTIDFNTFMNKISDLSARGVIDANYLNTVGARVGQQFGVQINSVMDLQSNQQMLDMAIQIMASENKWN